MTLQWSRPRKEQLSTGTIRRRWFSRCRNYYVEEQRHAGLPTVYLAIEMPAILLSRHRKRRAAELACERHDKKGGAR